MQKNYSRWNDFEIEVDERILNNINMKQLIGK